MAARNRLDALALRVLTLAGRIRRGEKGQGMVEYGLILMIITVALIIIVTTIGRQTDNMFSNASNGLR